MEARWYVKQAFAGPFSVDEPPRPVLSERPIPYPSSPSLAWAWSMRNPSPWILCLVRAESFFLVGRQEGFGGQ
jgi:hypothetical protein